jgi:hypothetical protein
MPRGGAVLSIRPCLLKKLFIISAAGARLKLRPLNPVYHFSRIESCQQGKPIYDDKESKMIPIIEREKSQNLLGTASLRVLRVFVARFAAFLCDLAASSIRILGHPAACDQAGVDL